MEETLSMSVKLSNHLWVKSLPYVWKSCALFPQQRDFVRDSACFVLASVSWCQPGWRHKASNTPPVKGADNRAHTWKEKHKCQNHLKKLCLLTGAGLPKIHFWPFVHELSAPTMFIVASEWRWCRVSVLNSQWIYYRSLSGPACQACDPGLRQLSLRGICETFISPVNCFNFLEWHTWKCCWKCDSCTDDTNGKWRWEGSRCLLCHKKAEGETRKQREHLYQVGHAIDDWWACSFSHHMKECDQSWKLAA